VFVGSLWGLTVWAGPAFAAPTVAKVDPPNWWVPYSRNPIQVLLTGTDLKGAQVTAAAPGFKVDVRRASDDGSYLFVYLDIDQNTKPGKYRFDVKQPSGAATFELALDRPADPRGRYQGVTPDDVIYLLMPDRFANGDPANDSSPEFTRAADRNTVNAYHGGDLRGVRERLPYLKDLGVTGIWMTPVYKNSRAGGAGAYHGYHTTDFYDVEPRFGTMAEFQALVDAAHQLGMKVVQDQVANHSGPGHPWLANPPTPTWFHDVNRRPRLRNNFDIAGLADPYARPNRRVSPLRGWFAGSLPDFDQTDPLCSDYIIQNALWWLEMTGLDGIRQDTYPYVDTPFWELWQTAIDKQYPTVFVVGEITAPNPAVLSFFQGGIRRNGIDTHLKSMLDFPLENAIRRVFGRGEPMTQLTDILSQDSLYLRPELLVAFLDNHDQPRFLTEAGGSDLTKLHMAQAFLLTTRRVPHLYYGDEIGMGTGTDRTDRSIRADFPGGFPGDTVNAFTPEGRRGDAALAYNRTRELLHFRKAHPAITRGNMVNLLTNNRDRYAYVRSSPEEYVLVALNRAGSGTPIELPVDDLAIPDGLRFRPYTGTGPEIAVANGRITIAEPKEVEIYWAPVKK
jgi:glycosidase